MARIAVTASGFATPLRLVSTNAAALTSSHTRFPLRLAAAITMKGPAASKASVEGSGIAEI
jgi:hypothetical protein